MAMTHADLAPPHDPGLPWAERDASMRHAMLTEILAQVSREALEGEGLEAVLQGIVDCLSRRLPVALSSIILLDEAQAYFVQEVWAGKLELDAPAGAAGSEAWPVSKGAAGRCARTGQPQLLSDVAHDPDYVPGHHSVRSEYLVPIRHRGHLLGVLNLESTEADFFSLEACAVFDAVAAQVGGAIHLARVVNELGAANRRLQQLSMIDGLTGIANRRRFDQQLQDDWSRLAAEQRPLALLLLDADCFKPLNDALGHQYGDECLRELARLCALAAGSAEELAARYGGEELALLLPGRDLRQARALAERLRRQVETMAMPHPSSTVAGHVTISIGVAIARPQDTPSPERLVAAADRALYAAKALGRNCVVGRTVAPAKTPRR